MAKSNIDKLMELKQLYEQGILTKEEMEAEKAKILNASTPKVESPNNEIPPVEDAESSFASTSEEENHGRNNKVIIGIAAAIVVAIVVIIGFFLNKQTEPKEAATDDIELAQLADDPFSDCIIIKDLFDIILKGDISELKTFLKTNGFKPNGKDEEYSSAEWTRVYGTGAESDNVSIQMEKVKELVYLDLSCTKDAIMDKWISEIKELGYTFEKSSVEGEDKTLSFNKSNGASGLIQYTSSPKRIRLNVITNFAFIVEKEDNANNSIAEMPTIQDLRKFSENYKAISDYGFTLIDKQSKKVIDEIADKEFEYVLIKEVYSLQFKSEHPTSGVYNGNMTITCVYSKNNEWGEPLMTIECDKETWNLLKKEAKNFLKMLNDSWAYYLNNYQMILFEKEGFISICSDNSISWN